MAANEWQISMVMNDFVNNRAFGNAINWLSRYIASDTNDGPIGRAYNMSSTTTTTTADSLPRDQLFRNLCWRSYCYYRLKRYDLALSDAKRATNLASDRYQPYLLGGFIQTDLKKYEESLQLFEIAIRLNHRLFEILIERLNFLKYKVLTNRGFDEFISFKSALQCRYVEECAAYVKQQTQQQTTANNNSSGGDSIINGNNINNGFKPTTTSSPEPLWESVFGDHMYISSRRSPADSIGGVSSTTTATMNDKAFLDDYCYKDDPKVYLDDEFDPKLDIDDNDDDNNNDNKVNNDDDDDDEYVDDDSDNESLDLEFRDLLRDKTVDNIDQNNSADNNKKESSPPWVTIGKSRTNVNSKPMVNNSNNSNDSGGGGGHQIPNNDMGGASQLCTFEETAAAAAANNGLQRTGRVRTDSCTSKLSDKSNGGGKAYVENVVTNLLKLRGVYIGNLKTNCSEKELKAAFKIYGDIIDFYKPAGETYVFVHYKSHESTGRLLADWNGRQFPGQCQDGKRLVIRFTPSQEQMSKYNSISLDEYKKRCNDALECHLWRSGQRCNYDRECQFRHVPACRAIDTVPDKRKSKWKVL
ncbi:uncharacterized protein LOC128956940 isoform X2 [Oppia nitens]|uniref:uncharacterized protein LOC128956940 isoform X2 n=1 Tax=Oppia nitens TaxID=1686743 RepID=UPI0023DB62A2|nr:uncharacterized protein LOC128956940 isoform X2 [Oppia nitens]